MSGKAFEAILLHFLVGTVRRPTILSHSVNRRHNSRPMSSALAVYIHWPVFWIVHELQELRYCAIGWALRCRQRNPVELHPGSLHEPLLIHSPVSCQINHCLDAQGGEICIVPLFRLSSAIIVVIQFAEIINVDACQGGAAVG